jgi:hypothetical protein
LGGKGLFRLLAFLKEACGGGGQSGKEHEKPVRHEEIWAGCADSLVGVEVEAVGEQEEAGVLGRVEEFLVSVMHVGIGWMVAVVCDPEDADGKEGGGGNDHPGPEEEMLQSAHEAEA